MSAPRPDDCADPLAALDKVVRVDETGVVTSKAVSVNESFFPGHFPGHPIYPGVFIVEAVHQAVRYYAGIYHGRVRLSELTSARFLRPVRPGDVLECDCRCTLLAEARQLKVAAVCRCEAQKVAEVKLVYALEEANDPRPG